MRISDEMVGLALHTTDNLSQAPSLALSRRKEAPGLANSVLMGSAHPVACGV